MLFQTQKKMSRLRKKLLLYFILISIVSVSVSAEIIFEVSSWRLQNSIMDNFLSHTGSYVDTETLGVIRQNADMREIFQPVREFIGRMILLLIVVTGCIIVALYMFTKDIVSPMDEMVEATKKIADGDLTVTVPVMSEDEIGLVASLINDMNINLQDMIMQIRQEINSHMEQIIKASYTISDFTNEKLTGEILDNKKMKMSDFKRIITFSKDIVYILERMSEELFALQKFVNMYKTYQPHTEVTQNEIYSAMKNFADTEQSE